MITDYAQQLRSSRAFFERSSAVLEEADSDFRPQAGMMSAAQQVAHVAQTIEWFIHGASSPTGFDLDFEAHAQALADMHSLSAAREWLAKAYENAIAFVKSADMAKPLAPGPVLGAQPTGEVIWAIVEHSAHHRGALTTYSRLLGKVPAMPYGA